MKRVFFWSVFYFLGTAVNKAIAVIFWQSASYVVSLLLNEVHSIYRKRVGLFYANLSLDHFALFF